MTQLTEKAIILKKIKHLESNLIIHAINSSGARISLFARGAAKSKKRFGGAVLEPLNYVQIVYRPGSHEGEESLGQISEATLINSFPKLRLDYDRLELAIYFLRLVLRLAQPGTVDNESLFNLLGHALKNLETSENLQNLKIQFELKFLALQGVLPNLLDSADLLRASLADHSHVQLDSLQRQAVQVQVSRLLDEYLGQI